MDKARWLALSPLLDELLDLDATARARRLAALAADDPELGEELRRCLAADGEAQEDGFLEAPDRKSTRLNSSHSQQSRMPSSA